MAYYIDGEKLPELGGSVTLQMTDLESGETGRDEAGFFHRAVLRQGLRSWEFSYRELTPRAYTALMAQLPRKDSFLLKGDSDAVRCWLASLEASRAESLKGPVYRLCFTVKEC